MCNGDDKRVVKILAHFSSHQDQKDHGRHIDIETCRDVGLEIMDLEEDDELQDCVLTTHHAFMHTFANTPTLKIIENHQGAAFIEQLPNHST